MNTGVGCHFLIQEKGTGKFDTQREEEKTLWSSRQRLKRCTNERLKWWNQRMAVATRSWKRHRIDSVELWEGTQPCHHPDFSNKCCWFWISGFKDCKWGLGSITMNKASGGDRIPAELLQVLKGYIVKVLHSICQQIWKTQQWPQDWKRSVFIPMPKKGYAKECSSYCIAAPISQASKVMLKILQASLQLCINWELSHVQAGFRKGKDTRGQIANICWIIEKAREFQKNIYFCFIDHAKAFDFKDLNNCGKFIKKQEYQTTLSASWEICMHIKRQ